MTKSRLPTLGVLLGLVSGLALVCQAATADPFDWSFSVIPPDISGPPGSTIGWGYTITNLNPDLWLVPTSLDAGLFVSSTPLSLFDFPILPPGGSITESYNEATSVGLYQLTWDSSAPLGRVNSGDFVVTADFFEGNPFDGGVDLDQDSQRSAAYSATVGNAVPEPRLWMLFVVSLALVVIARRRRAPC